MHSQLARQNLTTHNLTCHEHGLFLVVCRGAVGRRVLAKAEPRQGAVWSQRQVSPYHDALCVRARRLVLHVVHHEAQVLPVPRRGGTVIYDRQVRAFSSHGDHGACIRSYACMHKLRWGEQEVIKETRKVVILLTLD